MMEADPGGERMRMTLGSSAVGVSKQEKRDLLLETSRCWCYIESDGISHIRHSWGRSPEFKWILSHLTKYGTPA